MLLRITRSCSMACSHCMVSAQPCSQHMTMETLDKALHLCRALGAGALLVTGGEPFEHPQLERIVQRIKSSGLAVLITSNGEALMTPEGVAALDRMAVPVQVTNDRRYYPRRVSLPAHHLITEVDRVASIVEAGRAAENGIPGTRKAPACFNLRSLVHHSGMTLPAALQTLLGAGKLCTPTIDFDGSVRLGEHGDCPAIGAIDDSAEELTAKVRSCRCDACGLASKLPLHYQAAIGVAA